MKKKPKRPTQALRETFWIVKRWPSYARCKPWFVITSLSWFKHQARDTYLKSTGHSWTEERAAERRNGGDIAIVKVSIAEVTS